MSQAAGAPRAEVLIVDDNPENLSLLSQMLKQADYRVRVAGDGPRAIESVQSHPPDLILLDIMMPGMDGYQVCERLKAEETTRAIPVIFLSALDLAAGKVRAFDLGAVDYIAKPFQVKEVLARVRTHLAIRQLQQQLAQRVEELAERNQELDAFAHTVAHDLKNPLATLMGMADLVLAEREDLPPEQVDDLQRTIAWSARRINNIVEELLLLATLRRTDIEVQPIDMERVVSEVCNRLRGTFDQYHAVLVLPGAWPPALGYAPWVEEIWFNYLSNGCKYGGAPPRLELGAGPDPAGGIRFWVRDNGAGLTPEQRGRLFTPFTRLNQARTQGHGLGLSIVRRIAEHLDGRVGAESDGVPGRGSTFYFVLPVVPAES